MAALFFVVTDFGARAQGAPPAPNPGAQAAADVFHEAESKYMFGFIDGSDIGNEGEKAFEYEATGSFQKRGGHYTAIEHEFEFEYVPTQNFAFELSAHALTHSISGVEDLDDRNCDAVQRRVGEAALSHPRPRSRLAHRPHRLGGAGVGAR